MFQQGAFCRCLFVSFGLILIVGGALSAVFVGLQVVRPFIHTMMFSPVICTVTGADDMGFVTCSCGAECQSILPCWQVRVSYVTDDGHRQNSSILYQDGITWDKFRQNKCSVHACHRDHLQNQEDVTQFLAEHAEVGEEHECFYNPDETRETIMSKISLFTLLLATCVPGGCFLLGFFLTVVCCRGC